MTPDKNYYALLGIDEKADQEAIKKAYRRLAKKYHPDANPNNPRAAERFKDIGEANAVLSDPAKRKKYDQMRKQGPFGFRGARPGSRPDQQTSSGFSFEDIAGDIFSSFLDLRRKARPRRPSGPARGSNVEHTAEVPFMVAARGGRITVSVPIREECATCAGSGGAPDAAWKACSECRGSGNVSFGQGGFAVKRPCPACMGRGEATDQPCGACDGGGKVDQTRTTEVSVPAGAASGAKVRLTGKGQRGRRGGAPGDLIITLKVLSDNFFRREGNDVHVTVPINLAQAALGSRIRVRTISGGRVVLRIPPGTQPGTRFRIRGQGIEREGSRGDQFVEVKLEVPDKLSEEQERQIREFADSTGMKW